jgi:RNA polymerase sigma factor (sigma-70 family)
MAVEDNPLFKKFIPELKTVLKENTDAKVGVRRDLLGQLFGFEDKFRETLLSTDKGQALYEDFVEFIVKVKGNKLTYSVYFREEGDGLLKSIDRIFEQGDLAMLRGFKINYMFARWVIDNYRGPKRKVLIGIYDQLCAVRKTLCEQNLPLAINRAKIFFMKRQDLDYMDVIELASEGLLHAIDKFTLSRGDFADVAIGRMMVHMDDECSKTSIKLSPKDRRTLYRYNNAITKEKLHRDEDILAYVQKSFKGVTMGHLQALVIAVSQVVSIDEKRDDSLSILDRTAAESNPEEETTKMDLKFRLRKAVVELTVPERKTVRLKNNL